MRSLAAMRKKIIQFLSFQPFLFSFKIASQTPSIVWSKSLGHSTIGHEIEPALDGNFIVLGSIGSIDTAVYCKDIIE